MPTLAQTYYIAYFIPKKVTPIDVKENSGNNLTDYQIMIQLTSSWDGWSLVASDGSDIYFIDSSGNPLYFWIEKWDYTNKNAIIWVKIPSIPANGIVRIYMCYGGVNPYSSYRDGTKTFNFFDDFSSLSSNWVLGSWYNPNNPSKPTASIVDGWLRWTGTDSSGILYYNGGISHIGGFAVEGRVNPYSYPSNAGYYIFFIFASSSDASARTNQKASTGAIAYNKHYWSLVTYVGETDTSVAISQNVITRVSFRLTPNKQVLVVDGNTLATRTDALTLPNPIYLALFSADVDANTFDYRADYVFVRNYVDPEPSITINPSVAPKDIEVL